MESSFSASLLKSPSNYRERVGIIELVETVNFSLNYSKIVGLKI